MSIRREALSWLTSRGVRDGYVATSKRYAPDESWTKEKAWWVQIPTDAIREDKVIHIVCEAEIGTGGFRHLKVPASFFRAHRDDFATIGEDKINLFLAADGETEFQDQRGPGRISFARFEQE